MIPKRYVFLDVNLPKYGKETDVYAWKIITGWKVCVKNASNLSNMILKTKTADLNVWKGKCWLKINVSV